MKARYTVGGKVRIFLPDNVRLERDPHQASLVVDRDDFDELTTSIRDGDVAKAEQKRALDDALKQIERLSDERDVWKATAEALRPALFVDTADSWPDEDSSELRAKLELVSYQRDELTATVVRQANEITALKGESA